MFSIIPTMGNQTPLIKSDGIETDAIDSNIEKHRYKRHEIVMTFISIILRWVTVFFNIKLICNYWSTGRQNFAIWTLCFFVASLCITSLIYANMCYKDKKFSKGPKESAYTVLRIIFSAFGFRSWNALIYAMKCRQAERSNQLEKQSEYYKCVKQEESDIAFIVLFECFLESSPMKILQISIMLGYTDKISNEKIFQLIVICIHFVNITWSILCYHRYSRIVQIDKKNIKMFGSILMYFWYLFITISRTISISLVASIFYWHAAVFYIFYAAIFGSVTFIIDTPNFAPTSFLNFLFCLCIGIVYLFIYIPVTEGPTRKKYLIYYIICFLENIVCLYLVIAYSPVTNLTLIYVLSVGAFVLYIIGIVVMLLYYKYFHPKHTQ